MPDNTAAGPSRDHADQRDQPGERDDVTRTPGASGARSAGADTVSQGVVGRGPARAPEGGAARAGSGTRDGVLGGRDTAAQARAREGRDTMVDGERIPAGPGAADHDRSPARTGAAEGAREGITGKGAVGGRSAASPESVRGAEARVNAGTGAGTSGRLMHDEGDKWSLRLQQAVTAFVDGPQGSVEEADEVLRAVTERFVDAVTQRRRTLRASWQASGDAKADTEQLRLALKDYRELTERLLKL